MCKGFPASRQHASLSARAASHVCKTVALLQIGSPARKRSRFDPIDVLINIRDARWLFQDSYWLEGHAVIGQGLDNYEPKQYIQNVRLFLLCCTIATLFGCAAIRDYCKDAANPTACSAKFSLGVLSCEQEANRKTPIIKTATGNYLCNGMATQNGDSQQYRVDSTCRPEVKQTYDKAAWDANMRACIQAKMADGRFKQ
jgi:hypothetical protein